MNENEMSPEITVDVPVVNMVSENTNAVNASYVNIVSSNDTTTTDDTSAVAIDTEPTKKNTDGIVVRFTEENLKNLNYAELISERSNNRKSLDQLKNMKSTIDQMRSFYSDAKGLSDALKEYSSKMKDDEDIDGGFSDMLNNMDQFDSTYGENSDNLQANLDLIEKVIKDKYGDVEKTSTFISSQMIEVIDKNLNMLTHKKDEDDLYTVSIPENDLTFKQKEAISILRMRKAAIQDRGNMTFIMNRLTNPASINKTYLEVRKDFNKADKYIIKYTRRKFTAKQIAQIRMFLMVNVGAFSARMIMYQMAKLMRYGREDGKDIYPRLFYMNILDYAMNTYNCTTEDELLSKIYTIGNAYYNRMDKISQRMYEKSPTSELDRNQFSELLKLISDKKSKLTLSESMKKEDQEIKEAAEKVQETIPKSDSSTQI